VVNRKGFKTSPSIRVPRAAVEKHVQAAAAAAAAAAAEENTLLLAALRDALAMLDASSFGGQKTYRCLTAFEVTRLEEIRKLTGLPRPRQGERGRSVKP
jgi:hypothetical protein